MSSNNTKFLYGLVIFLAAAWLCNKINPAEKRNEAMLGGTAISRPPCLGVVNDLFGKAVDSNKVCDCLLPAYYELVKNDPEELTKFDYIGIHPLPGTRNEQINQLFTECIGKHIVDSTYTIHFTERFTSRFRELLVSILLTFFGTSVSDRCFRTSEALNECPTKTMSPLMLLASTHPARQGCFLRYIFPLQPWSAALTRAHGFEDSRQARNYDIPHKKRFYPCQGT